MTKIKMSMSRTTLSTDGIIKFVNFYIVCCWCLINYITKFFCSDEYGVKKPDKKFLAKIKIYDSAFSASTIDSFVVNEENKWLSHDRSKKKWPRTQDLKKMFMINNAIFGAKRNVYTKLNDRLGKKILPIVTPKLFDLDIDYLDDIKFLHKTKYIIISPNSIPPIINRVLSLIIALFVFL